MSDTAEYDIAVTAKDAIVHGIDSVGYVVDASATPSFGGTDTGEAFMAQNDTGDEAFNVYSFQGDDNLHEVEEQTPLILIILTGSPASNQVFGQEVKAVTITWFIQINMFDGFVTPDSVQLKEAKAMMVWRNRLIKVVEKISFPGISIIEERKTEPINIASDDGEGDAGDNMYWISGASKYIEYVEDI